MNGINLMDVNWVVWKNSIPVRGEGRGSVVTVEPPGNRSDARAAAPPVSLVFHGLGEENREGCFWFVSHRMQIIW